MTTAASFMMLSEQKRPRMALTIATLFLGYNKGGRVQSLSSIDVPESEWLVLTANMFQAARTRLESPS